MDIVELLKSQLFKSAVSNIHKRAESQSDISYLENIFVQSDIYTRLNSHDHQLILGRRGTGKTHMSKVFANNERLGGKYVIEIDCRNLGSGIISFDAHDELLIASKYFITLLNQIGTNILDDVMRIENPDSSIQEELYNRLLTVTSFFNADSKDTMSKFNYRQINESFNQILQKLNIREMFILIDEWAQVPIKSQPFLAEFLKRSFFSLPIISLKIMAVNYQCIFSLNIDGNNIGMQRGADITDVIDIDTYFVYDENPDQVNNIFSQILYNHLAVDLNWDLQKTVAEKYDFITDLFTNKLTFSELVRSSEGNARDFLCIFTRAYYNGYLASSKSNKISIPNIEKAAYDWFESEKLSNINVDITLQKGLKYILEKVIKGYNARTFMIREDQSLNEYILRLLNERILHKLNIRYSSRKEPGTRYNLFTLDFGAYIRFKGTEYQPEDLFYDTKDITLSPEDAEGSYVPIDDKRSIRNIILNPDEMFK